MRKNFFRSGLVAAVLVIALGYASCSDELDYNSSSDQYSELRGSGSVAVVDTLVGDSVQQYAGLVLSKIYFAGSGANVFDQYFKISNISDATIDAQGVVLLESKFVSTTYYYAFWDTTYNVSDPIDSLNFVTQVIYQIPNPTPIPPDESIVLAFQKANLSSSGGLDLTNADYGWKAGSQSPLLDKIFSYSASDWYPHNRGFRSYAIAALPDSTDATTASLDARGWKYTARYYYDVHNDKVDTTYTFYTTNAYKIPNEWIIDGVNVHAPILSTNVLRTIPYELDYGYTSAGTNNTAATSFLHAVTRQKDDSGRYIDTNDSSPGFDFLPNDPIIIPWP